MQDTKFCHSDTSILCEKQNDVAILVLFHFIWFSSGIQFIQQKQLYGTKLEIMLFLLQVELLIGGAALSYNFLYKKFEINTEILPT